MGGHSIFTLDEYGGFTELADTGYLGDITKRIVQRIKILPSKAQGEDG
jgi:hypothetical protein